MERFRVALLVLMVAALSGLLQPSATAEADRATPLGDFVGVNAVVNNDPSGLAQVAGWVRDYHKWYWYEPADDDFRWAQPWQYLDSFYGTLEAAGVKVMPDVEKAPNWATGNDRSDGIPNAPKHAEYLGALAAHYGDTIAAIENFNEPDKCCSDGKLSPESFGSMAALDFQAVRSANPSAIRVLAGLSNANTSYLDRAYRAVGDGCDVINFHWYAMGDTAKGGLNPESGHLLEQIDEIKGWRDAKAPGKPIWITEFGWDTFAQLDGRKSQIYAPESSAANYMLRAIFLMQGRGVERAFVYIYRDPTDNQAYLHYLYHSSGLVTDKWERDDRKKAGWYYLATLKNVLGRYAFDGIVSNGPDVYHYEYRVPGTSRRAAVLWARNGKRDQGYRANYRGPAGTLVEPVDGSTNGLSTATDGNLIISERPVFVLYTGDASQYQYPSPTPTPGPPHDDGLLVNGGFESDLGGWFYPTWFSEVIQPSWSHVHSGKQALRLDGTSQGPYIRQEVVVSAGERVGFAGWAEVARHEGDWPVDVILMLLHQWGGELLPAPIVVASFNGPTNGWVPFSGSYVMPERTVRVRVQIQCASLDGTAYFDDLALRTGDSLTSTPTGASHVDGDGDLYPYDAGHADQHFDRHHDGDFDPYAHDDGYVRAVRHSNTRPNACAIAPRVVDQQRVREPDGRMARALLDDQVDMGLHGHLSRRVRCSLHQGAKHRHLPVSGSPDISRAASGLHWMGLCPREERQHVDGGGDGGQGQCQPREGLPSGCPLRDHLWLGPGRGNGGDAGAHRQGEAGDPVPLPGWHGLRRRLVAAQRPVGLEAGVGAVRNRQ